MPRKEAGRKVGEPHPPREATGTCVCRGLGERTKHSPKGLSKEAFVPHEKHGELIPMIKVNIFKNDNFSIYKLCI